MIDIGNFQWKFTDIIKRASREINGKPSHLDTDL